MITKEELNTFMKLDSFIRYEVFPFILDTFFTRKSSITFESYCIEGKDVEFSYNEHCMGSNFDETFNALLEDIVEDDWKDRLIKREAEKERIRIESAKRKEIEEEEKVIEKEKRLYEKLKHKFEG
jgi:hypothetical protein